MMQNAWRFVALGLVFFGLLLGSGTEVNADPPPANPFPTPPPRVFCFRVTDIEAVDGYPDRFRFQFEMLNWTNRSAHGAYIWVNNGTYAVDGGAPNIVSATVDADGRGGPPGGAEIGAGNYNVPAHHSGRGRGDIPNHLNDWTTVFVGPTSVYWGADGSGGGVTPIPPRSILTAANSASQFALVPGLGEDGLGIGDAAIDGGPLPYGAPTQPAPFSAGGQPSPDGSGNVLDGFVIEIDDFDVGEVFSINWMLADDGGNSIGSVGSGGNTVGNEMGFGVFNVSRMAPGGELPPGPFLGNSGFNQDIRSFYSGIFEVPSDAEPAGPLAAEFGVEFGAAILAQPASSTVASEVPGTVTVNVPDLSVVEPNAEPMPCTIPSPLGDANDSGIINVADLVCQLLVTTWELAGASGSPPGCLQVPLTHIDLNCDGARTVADAVLNTYVVLQLAFPNAVDGNGNSCPDACDCSEAACDDDNACTIDQCDFTGGCTNTVVSCSDGDPCTFDTCDPASGCVFAPVGCGGAEGCFVVTGAPCDDGDACTTDDGCSGGTCTGATVSCDDGNPCTDDSCSGTEGCQNVDLANGTSCGGGDVCVEGECQTPAGCTSAAECPSDACTTYACQPAANFASNQCVIVSTTSCDDDNPCTDDSCVPATGCAYADNDTADCDDGDICTLNEACTGGVCVSDPNLCDDNNDCTTDFCDPVTGCWAIALDGVACDDGSACTTGDTCEVGFCVGADVVCNDGDVCTVDDCDPANGCDFTTSPCDDGDPCTGDSCDPVSGCDFAPLTGTACDDADVCTINDACLAGECTGTELTGCGPGTPTVCAVHGQVGDTVYCPIRVAALDSGLPPAAAFQATFTYPDAVATFIGVNDGEFCAPSEANCDQTLPWTIPLYQSALQSGHGVSMNPSDPAAWSGSGTVLALNTAAPTSLLTNAYLQNNQVVGDPLVLSLAFVLDQNVDANSPMLVTAGGVSVVSPDIVELAVYFDDAVVLTGSGDGTIPVGQPQGAVAGQSFEFADTFTCPPAHVCSVAYSSPAGSGTTAAGQEGASHASSALAEGAGTFSVTITPSGGGTSVVVDGPAFTIDPIPTQPCNPAPALGGPLNGPGDALRDCTAHMVAGSSVSGIYYIDPNGGDTSDAFQAYCDMITDGGGWTLFTNAITSGDNYVTSADLGTHFLFPTTQTEILGTAAEEIRYQCKQAGVENYIDVKTSDPLWISRPYSYGNACAESYNWTAGATVDHFSNLECNTHAYTAASNSTSCCCRVGHLLDTYLIGMHFSDWHINDKFYNWNTQVGGTMRCAGGNAEYMRMWYRSPLADCTGKVCGPDGADGSCGTCTGGQVCDEAGQCVDPPPQITSGGLIWDGSVDDLAAWDALLDVGFDELTVPITDSGTYLHFTDTGNTTMAYSASVDFLPTVEALGTIHVEGSSLEESAVYVFWEDDTGAFHNALCSDEFQGFEGSWSPAAQAQVPYACPDNGEDFTWDQTLTPPAGIDVERLHLRIFIRSIVDGDWVRVHRFGVEHGDYALIDSGGGVSTWSDGTLAVSCTQYRNPPTGYAAAQTSGLFQVDPEGNGTGFTVYCDQTTDGGGWTVIASQGGGLFGEDPRNQYDAAVPQPGNTAILSYYFQSDWKVIGNEFRAESTDGSTVLQYPMSDFDGPLVMDDDAFVDAADVPWAGLIAGTNPVTTHFQVGQVCSDASCRVESGVTQGDPPAYSSGLLVVVDGHNGEGVATPTGHIHFGGTPEIETQWALRGGLLCVRGTGSTQVGFAGTGYTGTTGTAAWDEPPCATGYEVTVTRTTGVGSPAVVESATLPVGTNTHDFGITDLGTHEVSVEALGCGASATSTTTFDATNPSPLCYGGDCAFDECPTPVWNNFTLPFPGSATYPTIVKTNQFGDVYAFPYSGGRRFIRVEGTTVTKNEVYSTGTPAQPGLDIDSAGNAHVCYFGNTLKYVKYDRAMDTFTEEDVSASAAGSYGSNQCDIAVDAAGNPFIVARDGGIRLFYKSGGSWTHELVSATGTNTPTVRVGFDGSMFVGYLTGNSSSSTMYLHKGTVGNWGTPTNFGTVTHSQYVAYGRGMFLLQSCSDTMFLHFSNGGPHYFWRSDDAGDNWTVLTQLSGTGIFGYSDVDPGGDILWFADQGSVKTYTISTDTVDTVLTSPGADPAILVNCAGGAVLISNDNQYRWYGCP